MVNVTRRMSSASSQSAPSAATTPSRADVQAASAANRLSWQAAFSTSGRPSQRDTFRAKSSIAESSASRAVPSCVDATEHAVGQ